MPLAAPLLAVFKEAAGAALRSGAAGGGVGGLARMWKTYGEASGATSAANADPLNAKLQNEAARATKNFAVSLGTSISPILSSFKQFKDGMDQWRDSLVEGQRGLAAFNASIAKSYNTLNIGDMQRKLELGRMTSGTIRQLIGSENDRRNSTMNADAFWANASNRIGTMWNQLGTMFNKALDPIYASLNKLVEASESKDLSKDWGLEFEDALARRHLSEQGTRRRTPLPPV